jgi:GTP-binding protein LepA
MASGSDLLGVEPSTILACSAKTGEGVKPILERVISDVPPPQAMTQSLSKLLFSIPNSIPSGGSSLL